jgi:dihydroorotase
VTGLGVDADASCLAKGVTTALDAGSAGATNIEGFKRYIMEPARLRQRALLNISAVGMPFNGMALTELAWLPLADVGDAVAAVEAHRDWVIGLKVRITNYIVKENGASPLPLALEAGRRAGVPVMVHIGDSPIPVSEILDALRPGDILTHTYTAFAGIGSADGGKTTKNQYVPRGRGNSILDAAGKVVPAAWKARERGVILDVGHGVGSFSFAVASDAMAQGLKPDTIGSDLHTGSIVGPVFDLPTLMSRFLSLGMTLSEVIAATTSRPAAVMGLAGECGTLRPGAAGDVAVLELQSGRFEYRDAAGDAFWGDKKLLPRVTVRAGEVVARDGRLT